MAQPFAALDDALDDATARFRNAIDVATRGLRDTVDALQTRVAEVERENAELRQRAAASLARAETAELRLSTRCPKGQ